MLDCFKMDFFFEVPSLLKDYLDVISTGIGFIITFEFLSVETNFVPLTTSGGFEESMLFLKLLSKFLTLLSFFVLSFSSLFLA